MTDAVAWEDVQRPLDECGPRTADPPPGPLRTATPPAPVGAAPGSGTGRLPRPHRWLHGTVRWLRRTLVRTAHALVRWSRGPAGRLALPSATVLVLVAAAVTAGAVAVPGSGASAGSDPSARDRPGPATPSAGPTPAAAPTAAPTGGPGGNSGNGIPADVLRGWAQQMSARTGIPAVALQAYGYAELVVARTTPGCRLSWTTLAAIGRVESNHGRTGGAALGADGRAWPAVIGPALDGRADRRLIEDTDDGGIDGDSVYDRAVGPMQFIPQTWRAARVDATGDGVADPHNVHDAALAAANYLCRGGRDLSAPADWWEAVLAYNDVQRYADEVFTTANDYGRASRG